MRAETRHQLKQDAFSRVTIRTAQNTAHWSAEHKSTIAIGATVVIVVLAAVIGGWYYLSSQDQKASFEFSQAVRTMETPLRPADQPAQPDYPTYTSAKERSAAAHKQFQEIASKYSHTRTGEMARYFVGVTAADMGDTAAAERDFKDVADHGNRELASIARMALASLYTNTNRTKDAVAIYQELIAKPTNAAGKVSVQMQLAELYQHSNQPLDAKRIYEEIKKDNPANEAGQLATQKLADLK